MSRLEKFKEPTTQRRFNGHATVFWILNVPLVIAAYIVMDPETFQTVMMLYLAVISVWANVGAHWGAYISARVEVKQDE